MQTLKSLDFVLIRSFAIASILFVFSGIARAKDLEPVRLQLQYFHQFQFAGFYAAQYLGLYEQAGLRVDILEGRPELDTIASVISSDVDFAVSDTELLWRRLQGAPIVALGVIFQNSGYCLVSLNSSNIMTLQDLKGKRLGIAEGRGSYLFNALLRQNKIPQNSFERVDPRWNLESLVQGEIDAGGAYVTGELYHLRELGLSYQIIDPIDYGVEFYGDTLFTSEALIERSPELVESFRKASIAGWKYAFEHSEEVIEYILRFESVERRKISRDRLRYEATIMRHLVLPDIIELGSMKDSRWQRMAYQLQDDPKANFNLDRLKGFVYETPTEKWRQWSRYAARGLGIVLCLFLGSLIWILQLRKAVRARTKELGESVRLAELHEREAKDANAAKSMFLAGISHELKTPLTSILGFSDLMKKTSLDQQQAKWMGIIRARAADLLALVNQILNLVQVENGSSAHAERIDFDLSKEVERIGHSFGPILAERSLNFTIKLDPTVPNHLYGVDLYLRQVLFNLIGNATKFVDNGGHIELSCREMVEARADHSHLLLFAVCDDGPGVPEAMKEAIFEPFQQVHEGHRHKDQGSGLGLAICRKLVNTLGGTIWVENKQPQGCCFYFTARFAASSQTAMPEESHEKKVLLVEDDAVNRELIRTYLAMSGFRIVEADSGQFAIKRCEQETFDVILMDLGLPDIDGYKATERILSSSESKNRHTPIAALTASPLHKERERCFKAGMKAFIGKPVNFDELVQTLQKLASEPQTA